MKSVIVALTASILIAPSGLGNVNQVNSVTCQQKPVVSGQWLDSHRDLRGLIIIDVRTAAEYAAGHIADSVNIPLEVPVSAWTASRDDLLLELPDRAELFGALGSYGVRNDSKVVLVTGFGQPPYPQANATRAALTLRYAGVRTVSILDGGYPRWVTEGRPTTTEVPAVTAVTFRGRINDDALIDIDSVHQRIGSTLILDARDAEVYSGAVVEPWADQAGHIPSAVSLPAPLIWNEDGTYKSKRELASLFRNAAGIRSHHSEIIVYCGVGGYASSWLFVLREILGYQNVRMYDGSAQEWVRYHEMEL